MSGSGFRTWQTGEVVTATNMQNYLQKQVVMYFATVSARDAAITSPEKGMIAYTDDVGVYWWYDAGITQWVPLAYGWQWTTYTPTWTSTGTAPAIGNGTLSGRYAQQGKTVHLVVEISWGTTTSAGTGGYRLSLPSGLTARTTLEQCLTGRFFDSSANVAVAGSCTLSGGTFVALQYMRPSLAGDTVEITSVTGTAPATWANGDKLRAWGTFELA